METLVWIFVTFVFTLFSSIDAQRRAARAKSGKKSSNGHLVNSRTTDFIIPFLFGPGRGGGNIEYEAISGDDRRYLHRIIICGWGPIEGVYLKDGTIFTDEWTQLPTTLTNPAEVYLDGKLWTQTNKYNNVYIEFFRGSADQVCCATLAAAIPQFTDTFRNKFGFYVRLLYNQEIMPIPPTITIKFAGMRCYDPTAGTLEYTQNFALHAHEIMTRPKELGGMGIDTWQGLTGGEHNPGGLILDPNFDREDGTYWTYTDECDYGEAYGYAGEKPGVRFVVGPSESVFDDSVTVFDDSVTTFEDL